MSGPTGLDLVEMARERLWAKHVQRCRSEGLTGSGEAIDLLMKGSVWIRYHLDEDGQIHREHISNDRVVRVFEEEDEE